MDYDTESCVSSPTSPMSAFSGCGGSIDGLLAAYANFKRSGLPARFLRFDGDKWLDDIPAAANNLLRDAFSAGRTATDVAIDGRRYLFDFLGMRMVDWSTAAKHSIAWIDVDGHSFYPEEFAGKMPSSSSEVVGPRRQWPGAVCLHATSDLYRGLEWVFKWGVREIDSGAALVAAYRRVDSGERRRERFRKFKEFEQRVRCVRGNANSKFGWYGGPPNAIASVLENGFSAAEISVRLTPAARAPNLSIFSAEADECKERHLLLCRVILGNPEQVATDYKQVQPSSNEFDSGVDNLKHPNWYIIWGDNVNLQVIPECIVTFKSSVLDPPTAARKPPLNVPVSKLLSEIDGFLTPGSREEIGNIFSQLKKGRINRMDFLRSIKKIAGDELLRSVVKRLFEHR